MKIRTWSDENGELFRSVIAGNKSYISKTTPAWEPGAGKISKTKVSANEAEDFDPDEVGELVFKETSN